METCIPNHEAMQSFVQVVVLTSVVLFVVGGIIGGIVGVHLAGRK